MSRLAGHFWQTPISSTKLLKDHLGTFRTFLLWREMQRFGRATNAAISHSLPRACTQVESFCFGIGFFLLWKERGALWSHRHPLS